MPLVDRATSPVLMCPRPATLVDLRQLKRIWELVKVKANTNPRIKSTRPLPMTVEVVIRANTTAAKHHHMLLM